MNAIPTGDSRQRRLINKIQSTYVFQQLCWTAVILIVFAGLVFGPTAYDVFYGSPPQQEYAARMLRELHLRFWAAWIALAAALSALAVIHTHRVVGPLVRFRAVFGAIGRGELWVNAAIRAGDYPEVEGRALRDMLASLRQHIRDAQRATAGLEAALDQLPPDTANEARAALAQLQYVLAAYEVDRPVVESDSPPAVARPVAPE